MSEGTDFLIIGAGIVGLSVALELKRRYADCNVVIIEKEPDAGLHASGRNSGVLHAGFYYSSDTLKARLCREGNQAMREFCLEHGVPVRECGKLVLACSESDLIGLDVLFDRACANGVAVEKADASAVREIEPRAKCNHRALYSPTTATVNPLEVTRAFLYEVLSKGVAVRFSEPFIERSDKAIRTPRSDYEAKYVINAAGLHADRVAHRYEMGTDLAILPFKGLYLHSTEPLGSLRTNIYPVPNLANPFLGVHATVTQDGHMKIGPTAIPCLWREQYSGLSRFSLRDAWEIVLREIPLLIGGGFDFRSLAWKEIQKMRKKEIVNQASLLVEGLSVEQFPQWGAPGIRAQLINVKERKLLMDFHLECDDRSMHILNAVSPAFTCAIPFARYVVDKIGAQ